jgi:exonuclease SbcD
VVSAAAVQARYAGSLLQLDFGEREQAKSVVLIDIEPGLPAQVRTVPLNGGRKLLDVAGTLDELRSSAVDPEAYLRVMLSCDGPSPGLADDVRAILPRALEVRLDYERAAGTQEPGEVSRLAPRELFARYYERRHGSSADERLVRLFDELFEEVTGEAA